MLKSFTQNIQLLFAGITLLFLLCLGYALLNSSWVIMAVPCAVVFAFFVLFDIELPFKLLLLTIPLSFSMERVLPIQLDFPDEIFQLFITFLMLFYFIIKRDVYSKQFISHPLIGLVLLGFFWTAVTTFASSDIALSMKFLLRKVWYIVPFVFFSYAYFQDAKRVKQGFVLMFSVLLLIVFIVMYKAKGAGFSFDDVHDPIQPFFKNHVMYGSMISSFFFLIIGAFLNGRKGSFHKLFFAFGILLFLVAIYFSYSRGAWAATLFGIGTMVLIKWRKMHWGIGLFYALVLVFVLWLGNNNKYLQYRPKFEKTVMHESLADHLMATIQGTDISSAERYYRWIAAVRMSKDKPLVGYGPNMFYDSYKPYTISAFKTWVSRNLERSTSHNYFLFMLVEQGYPGLIIYAIFIFMIFYLGQKIYHNSTNKFDRNIILAVLGMLGAIFINNFFSELLETDKIGSLFYIGVTLLVIYDIKQKKLAQPNS